MSVPKERVTAFPAPPELIDIQIDDFLAVKVPPQKQLLSPWLRSSTLHMLYAQRGIGKTWAALSIAYAVASGGRFLNWHAETPSKVLYIDGEMATGDMQERLQIVQDMSEREAAGPYFRLISPDFQDEMPDLATHRGQAMVDKKLKDAELIVVDNISCLCRSGVENDAESWTVVADWALRMRRERRAVLFVHHASKSGDQRGTSKREDILDTSIRLKPLEGSEGAAFELEFTKARGLTGCEREPLEARLVTDAAGHPCWTTNRAVDTRLERVRELKAAGLSIREIGEEVGLSKTQVARILNR